MVGVFLRVFEVGKVYRAEPHSTSRHINEYVSLDVELGFIDGFEDLMRLEARLLDAMFQKLKECNAEALSALAITLPKVTEIPCLHLEEAFDLISEQNGGEQVERSGSLTAQQEKQLCKAVFERYGSEFVFVTHYSSEERPFYAKDDPANNNTTLSFDLLFRGLEITTGGERIDGLEELTAKMKRRGMALEPFKHYLMIFKHGMPRHGGFAIGLERLTALLLGEENVRQGSLFPRDINRLAP